MRWLRYILLVLIFIAGLEISVRVDDWLVCGALPWSTFNQENLFDFDAIGKRGHPFAHYHKWTLNSLGFRGPELRSDTLRIATAGSSETFGLHESPGHEWPRLLEQTLNKQPGSSDIEVVNVAYPGMLLATFDKRLPEFMQLTEPQVVVIYANPTSYLYGETADTTPLDPVLFEWRIKDRVSAVVKQYFPRKLESLLKVAIAKIVLARNRLPVWETLPTIFLERFERDARRVVTALQARGIKPVLITHATVFGDSLEPEEADDFLMLRKFYPFVGADALWNFENDANNIVRKIAAEQGVVLIDAAKNLPGGHDVFVDFVHFTDSGSQRFTDLVAEKLRCLKNNPADCLSKQGR